MYLLQPTDLLELAVKGDVTELIRELGMTTANIHSTDVRKEMTESEKLMDEALWYARHGDLDEAIYRLSQA